jgi:hypothetical protein
LIQTNKTKSNRYKSLVWVSVMNMNLILSRNSVWWILIHYNDSPPKLGVANLFFLFVTWIVVILRLVDDILTWIVTFIFIVNILCDS